MITVFHAKLYGIRATSGERKFIERIKAPILLVVVLAIEIIRALIQLRRELSFSSFEISKPLPVPVDSVIDQIQVLH